MTMTAAIFMAAASLVPTTLPEPDLSALFRTVTLVVDPGTTDETVVAPPHGYADMCKTDSALCAALAASNPGAVEHDETAQRALLHRINHEVNARVRQQSDLETVGVIDKWRRTGLGADATGDCEDMAIEKRLDLIAAGFPADHLYFAVGYRGTIGLHAVLVAQVGGDDVVLDSRTSAMPTWRRAPYIWVSRQTPGAPDRWTNPMPMRMATVATPNIAFGGTTIASND